MDRYKMLVIERNKETLKFLDCLGPTEQCEQMNTASMMISTHALPIIIMTTTTTKHEQKKIVEEMHPLTSLLLHCWTNLGQLKTVERRNNDKAPATDKSKKTLVQHVVGLDTFFFCVEIFVAKCSVHHPILIFHFGTDVPVVLIFFVVASPIACSRMFASSDTHT
jgi:hypothetical protein